VRIGDYLVTVTEAAPRRIRKLHFAKVNESSVAAEAK
jgi:hypothetical protein